MLTDEQLSAVKAVHRKVFAIFEYQTDKEQFGQLEYWQDTKQLQEALAAGKLVGDCDDFALACRHLLREQGIPNRLVLCIADGEGHLVLEAEGYILDNRHEQVMRVDELQYEWIKMSGYDNGDPWTTVQK